MVGTRITGVAVGFGFGISPLCPGNCNEALAVAVAIGILYLGAAGPAKCPKETNIMAVTVTTQITTRARATFTNLGPANGITSVLPPRLYTNPANAALGCSTRRITLSTTDTYV